MILRRCSLTTVQSLCACLLALALITGCGQTTVQDLKVTDPSPANGPGKGLTAVILPFADYSYADNLESAHRRNMAITEALTDQLIAQGFSLPVQEDVFHYLVEEKVISLVPYEAASSTTLSYEISDSDWSGLMRNKLRQYLDQQNTAKGKSITDSPGTHGLSPQTIVKLGRDFNADFIIRGRILEFKTRQEHSWAPWKRGLLPFVIGSANRMAFGFADSDTYDDWSNMTTGGTMGAIIGHNVSSPWNASEVSANTIFWGAVGAGMGHMSRHTGQVDQAVVQMRIWVQDAYNGDVVWTNRIEVRVAPESVLADSQYDDLFNSAISKATETLISNFVSTSL